MGQSDIIGLMIRTQISLESEQMARARREADRRGMSLAALIRKALDEFLDDEGRRARRRRAIAAVGGFRSGTAGTSVEHDEALAEDAAW